MLFSREEFIENPFFSYGTWNFCKTAGKTDFFIEKKKPPGIAWNLNFKIDWQP